MTNRSRCAALILMLGATLPCAAQDARVPPNTAPQTAVPPTRDRKACPEGQGARSGSNAPQSASPGAQTLSDKLAQTDGVICPPDIDPDIKAPTPQAGPMPVIPPPGSPGGDPTVRPK
jgi:hypothetical protein